MKRLLDRIQDRVLYAVGTTAAVLAVGWWWLLAPAANQGRVRGSEGDWVVIGRGDLILTIEVTGTLQAVHSQLLGPPPIPRTWEFKIAYMAPEGTEVRKGERVLAFDTSELEGQLEEATASFDAAVKEIEKKETDLAIRRRDDELRLAEATAKREKAALKLDRPSELVAANELAQFRIDLELAEKEIAYLRERIASLDRAARAELSILREERDRAAARVQEIRQSIARMAVTAPRDGTVIHVTDRRGQKKRVGDACWWRERIVEIPDLTEMRGEAEVDEVDAGKVAIGQPVLFRLDAYPDLELSGGVQSTGATVQRPSPWSPLKILRLKVGLDETDPLRMRPGMRFRGTIETDRISQALLIPSGAVFPTENGPIAYRRSMMGFEKAHLTLGRRNAQWVEVLGGLSEGDRVSSRMLDELEEG
ncbi:MAG: efflux RND transporter periplasmic adaptor subunit [Acidobacteriota bacterium]